MENLLSEINAVSGIGSAVITRELPPNKRLPIVGFSLLLPGIWGLAAAVVSVERDRALRAAQAPPADGSGGTRDGSASGTGGPATPAPPPPPPGSATPPAPPPSTPPSAAAPELSTALEDLAGAINHHANEIAAVVEVVKNMGPPPADAVTKKGK